MHSDRHDRLWRRALLLTLAAFVLASPVLVSSYMDSYQAGADQRLAIWPLPEDPTARRKANLINALLPHIQNSNRDILADRARLAGLVERLQAGKSLKARDLKWLRKQGERYNVAEEDLQTLDGLQQLRRRMDIIPADLALAQAAMESAWGTSRFAKEGNNYFGQWCFKAGCGLVPNKRPEGASYEVATFDSAADSVRGYMDNLNSHRRYRQLRSLRQQAREAQRDPDGHTLAAGLEGYSTIGEQYIRAIRGLIKSNELSRFASY